MATSGHELESINVSGLKATMKDAGNIGLFNEATCSTAAGTAAKEVTKPTSFTLTTGATIVVKFTNAITVASATLNVGSTGAKAIYYRGAALAANRVAAGDRLILRYNGTQFDIIGHLDTDTNTQAVSSVVGQTGAVTATQIGTALTNAGYKLTDNNTWNAASTSQAGYVPAATKGKFLHSNASTGNLEWVNDNNTTYTPQKLGIGIGTCSTSSGTALTVSLTGYELVTNGFVAVTFANDVPANATLNINGKGAKPIIYKGSAIESDTIKADDTVMFCYNGSQYVVTSLGGGAAPVNPNETVNISLTQVGGNSADLTGASITITDDDSGDTLYTTTWAGSTITTEIDVNTNYTVSVETIAGYLACPDQSYQAGYQTERNISFQYRASGAYVEATDGTLYTSSAWASSGKTANAVVVLTDACKVRMALTETTLPIHSNYIDPLENYITTKRDETTAKADYDGEGNTDNIIRFNIAYNTNTTSYAAPYCRAFTFTYPTGQKGSLPAAGQVWTIRQNKTSINACLTACGGTPITSVYWSSTCYGKHSDGFQHNWYLRHDDALGHDYIRETSKVRPVSNYIVTE